MSLSPVSSNSFRAAPDQTSDLHEIRTPTASPGDSIRSSAYAAQDQESSCPPIVQGFINTAQWVATAIQSFFQSVIAFFTNLFSPKAPEYVPEEETPTEPLTDVVIVTDPPAPHVHQGLSINTAKLSTGPTPIDPALLAHIADNANPPIHLNELITIFNQIFHHIGEHDVLHTDEGNHDISKSESRRSIQSDYIDFASQHHHGQDYINAVATETELLLKNIIFELRKPEIAPATKIEVLKNLARAAEHCPPRRHIVALQQYRALSNQMETLEEVVLQFNQQIKEDLFREHYSLSSESAATMNYIRRKVGARLGLDTRQINLDDMYIRMNDARSPENPHHTHRTADEFMGVFNRIYTTENLIRLMKDRFNNRFLQDRELQNSIGMFLSDAIGTAFDAAEPDPYMDNNTYMLKDEGVKFLLTHFQILNSPPT